MPIQPGDETTRLTRERGWTHWHHLFAPRHLLIGAILRKRMLSMGSGVEALGVAISVCDTLDRLSRLTRWHVGSPGCTGVAPTGDKVENVFHNQALNTFVDYAGRSVAVLEDAMSPNAKWFPIARSGTIAVKSANEIDQNSDFWITDPPYADAINYHEITEYFMAWLRTSLENS
jgi:putative DNA methylase